MSEESDEPRSRPSGGSASEPPARRRRQRRTIASEPPEAGLAQPGALLDEAEELLEAPPPRTPTSKARLYFRRTLKVLAYGTLLLVLIGVGGVTVVFSYYSRGLPSTEALKNDYDPPQITRIYARDETLLATVFRERRTVIPFEQISDATKLAFLAAEDAHFYEHEGLNYFGILRALAANLRAGKKIQGGSTITQQVVKNVLLDPERTLSRKIREALLARRLEQSLSKDEIFWLYLNHIYLGHGRYGVEEASRYYFGKPARELALDEATTLAGLVAAPERYSPRKSPERSLRRRRFVLNQMLQKRFVTRELYEQSLAAPLRLAPAEEAESRLAPEMIDRVKALLSEVVPGEAANGGFSVYTTIDPDLQSAARTAVRENLDAYMERHELKPPYTVPSRKMWPEPLTGTPAPYRVYTGVVEETDDKSGTIFVRVGDTTGRVTLSAERRYNPGGLLPSQFTKPGAVLRVSLTEPPDPEDPESKPALRLELGPQSALVAVDARNREVLALVGSYEGIQGGLDRATQAHRQPGSSFKPILFSYALHSRHVTAATPIAVTSRGHGVADKGPIQLSLRDALAHSNNEAAQELLKRVGPQNVVQWARALGIESPLKPDLSLALGAYEVTPAELVNAYVTFANGGKAGSLSFVRRIVGPDGKEVPLRTPPPEREVMTPEEAYLTTSLLHSVVEYGTGRAARALHRDVAGKTGTTNRPDDRRQSKDAWFVGYSTDIAAAVWVGYDDSSSLGVRESGARSALPAWATFMKAAHESLPRTKFARPREVLLVRVDPTTGKLPRPNQRDTKTEEFLSGTEPTESAPFDAGAPRAATEVSRDAGARSPRRSEASEDLPPF